MLARLGHVFVCLAVTAGALFALSSVALADDPQPSGGGVSDAQSAPDEAAAQAIAASFGHPVAVDSETNETAEVVAEPDGSFRLTSSPLPVRVQKADGSWQAVNLDLQAGELGLAPAATAVPVEFSAGGAAPLARVRAASGDWLTQTWSAGTLPAPQVSGASAVYADVLPGVDLRVTATPVGMSDVLIIRDAAAAANPALASVRFGIDDGSMSSTVSADGSLVTKAADGTTQLVSDAPTWWDSSSAGASAAGPGGNGVPEPVAHSESASDITIDASVAASPGVTYPVYVDPPTAFTGDRVSYTFVDSAFKTTSYWNGSGASDAYAHVGYIDSSHSDDGRAHLTRSFWSLNTSWLANRYIQHADFDATEVYSSSCTANSVELWTAGAATSSTTWNTQPGFADNIITTSMAHGYNSACPAAAVGWDVTTAVQRAADAAADTINLALKVPTSEEGDWTSWKKFRND